jgi:hypothetical protein
MTAVSLLKKVDVMRTSVNQANAEQIGAIILDSHCIMVCDLAKIVGISVSSVKIIIYMN